MSKFLVNGKEFEVDPPTPRQQEIKKLLDSMKHEVVDLKELGKRIGPINADTLRDFGHRYPGYTYKTGVKIYYGSKESIVEFRQRIEQARKKS